jgi:hypothetical protein
MAYTTFADLILHGSDYLGLDSNSTSIRAITDATVSALRALESVSTWRYFRRTQLLNLHAIVTSEATASYTHATRTVVWPENLPSWFDAGSAVNVAGPTCYVVESLVVGSTTNFVLQPFSNPGEDQTFAIGTNLCQYTFDLPDDFAAMASVGLVATSYLVLFPVSSQDMAEMLRRTFATGTPVRYAVVGSTSTLGQQAIQLHPVPNVAGGKVSILYTRHPRALRIRDNRAGTVTGTAGLATVTGTGTAFSQAMVGSVIRFTDTGEYPTGLTDTNPYLEERTILQVTSATSLTVSAPLAYSYATKKYVISDPVDCPRYMMSLLYRLVERELRLVKRIDGKPEEAEALMLETLRSMEMDNSITVNEIAGPGSGVADLSPMYIYSTNLRY